jgi:hypothetical protein
MLQPNEIVMALLATGVLVLVLSNTAHLRRLPRWPLLIAAFLCFAAACVLTVLETFLLETALNTAEHLAYAVSAVLTALWCRAIFRKPPERNDADPVHP